VGAVLGGTMSAEIRKWGGQEKGGYHKSTYMSMQKENRVPLACTYRSRGLVYVL
jgi:hypothetical protein